MLLSPWGKETFRTLRNRVFSDWQHRDRCSELQATEHALLMPHARAKVNYVLCAQPVLCPPSLGAPTPELAHMLPSRTERAELLGCSEYFSKSLPAGLQVRSL